MTIRIASPQARPSTRNYNNTGAARLSAALETLNEEEGCGIGKGRRDAHAPMASWLYAHGFGTRRGSTGLVVSQSAGHLAVTRLQAIVNLFLMRRMKTTLLDGKRLIELPERTIELVTLVFSQGRDGPPSKV
ncbi:hypothetical protein B0H14DRAFT_2623125 [Mycena olivaceomarginata]|nr:hypothetical protein B0H14DRAFT_2623125 [Mycena olivaceomarginata]